MNSDVTQIMGEFIGTLILVSLGNGVCAAVNLNKSKAQTSGWIAIVLGWGLAVTMAVYISGLVGPAHLDPTVSLVMAITGTTSWDLAVPFIIAQVLGTFAGAILAWLSYLPYWNAMKDGSTILGTFTTGPAVRNYPANVITELVGTFVLVLGLLTFRQNEFASETNIFTVGGLTLAIGLSLEGPTGYAINSVRDFSPRLTRTVLPIVNRGTSDWAYSWILIASLIVGAIIAVGTYSSMV